MKIAIVTITARSNPRLDVAARTLAHTIGKPVVFVSVGQGYDDIRRFNVKWMVDRLLSAEEKEA